MTARFGTMGMMAGAVAATLGFYTMSLGVSAERAANQELKAQIAADLKDIRALEAELRTRARLPQLERWNEDVLAMSAPSAKQFLNRPVQLAAYAPKPVPAPMQAEPQQAVADAAEAIERASAAAVVPAKASRDTDQERVQLAALTIPEPRVDNLRVSAPDRGAPAKSPSPAPERQEPAAPVDMQRVETAAIDTLDLPAPAARMMPGDTTGFGSPAGLTEALIGQIENSAARERMFRTISMQ
jgi:hypothetical protein